jgi:hypothetical protein
MTSNGAVHATVCQIGWGQGDHAKFRGSDWGEQQATCLLVATLQEHLIDCQLIPDLVLQHNGDDSKPDQPHVNPTHLILASSHATMDAW